MRRTVFAFVFALFVSTAAQAVTLRDIVELTKAGLGDEVLLALIDVDGGVFDIDAATLKSLKAAGVSERVIVALVRSGRERPPLLPRGDPRGRRFAAGAPGGCLRRSSGTDGRSRGRRPLPGLCRRYRSSPPAEGADTSGSRPRPFTSSRRSPLPKRSAGPQRYSHRLAGAVARRSRSTGARAASFGPTPGSRS